MAVADCHVRGIHHVELYVGNAVAMSEWLVGALGLSPLASAGVETGLRDRECRLVGAGGLRLLVTSPLGRDGPIADHVRAHGDALRDIAFEVSDAEALFERCVGAGARVVSQPARIEADGGELVRAAVGGPGDVVHSLLERRAGAGPLLAGFRPGTRAVPGAATDLVAVDHVACCVEPGAVAEWTAFYEAAFGFRETHREDVRTGRSGMRSRVVGTGDGAVRLPLMEPLGGPVRSQIAEFLAGHGAPGAQHVALLTADIVATVRTLRERGALRFLETPGRYYDELSPGAGDLGVAPADLRELGILVDRDEWGHLYQIFTGPITGRPTLFLEFIERRGARGFGGGNIRALFESVERDRGERGDSRPGARGRG